MNISKVFLKSGDVETLESYSPRLTTETFKND